MTHLRHLRAVDRRAMPWKNGGGMTQDVVISPEGAGFSSFDWRISIATISQGGPFSSFLNIERKLAVIRGSLILDIGGRGPINLTPLSAPLTFSGSDPVHASLLDGPVMDLNVMTRQGRFESTLQRHVLGAPQKLQSHAESCVIVSLGRTLITHRRERVILDEFDALLVEGLADLELAPFLKASDCYVIEIFQ